MRIPPLLAAAALGLLALRDPAAAQGVAGCARDTVAARDTAGARPDVLLDARVTARELRFEARPRVDVRLSGCGALDTVQLLERRNLPRPVQPGETYRDVAVRVQVRAYFDVQCLLADTGAAPADTAAARRRSALLALCPPGAADTLPPPRRR